MSGPDKALRIWEAYGVKVKKAMLEISDSVAMIPDANAGQKTNRCWNSDCSRRALFTDWAGWRWCWRHAWRYGRKSA